MGGGDKCLLPLGGRPLLAHVIERLRSQVASLVINAKDFNLNRPEDFSQAEALLRAQGRPAADG
jgi:molybdopterin-guanine dinucleotide biosynthesis protein A